MLGDLLQARYRWHRGELEFACAHVNAAIDPVSPAFALTESEYERYRGKLFDVFLADVLLGENILVVPFAFAFAKLWSALPIQALVWIASQRRLDPAQDSQLISLFHEAAAEGLLSTDVQDYDVSGKVVINPAQDQGLIDFVGGSAFLGRIERAANEACWARMAANHGDRIVDQFLYNVFHRESTPSATMISIRLGRIVDDFLPFLDAFRRHAEQRLSEDRTQEARFVSLGMRIETPEPATCVREFFESARSHQFDGFVERYYPSPEG
jgi:hypothetical protein